MRKRHRITDMVTFAHLQFNRLPKILFCPNI